MGKLQGDLSVMPLADLVIWLANRKSHGLLTVERANTKKQFTLERGMVVRASSDDPREYFGQFLIHFGLLTEDQLERAFDTQRQTRVLLGKILVMIGIVREEQVIQALRVKMGETLLDTFRWVNAQFTYEDVPPAAAEAEISVALPILDIHREASNRVAMWEQYDRVFARDAMTLAFADTSITRGINPDSLDGRIIALAKHGLSIGAIKLELHATDYQIATRLFDLHRMGLVVPGEGVDSFHEEPTPLPESSSHIASAREALDVADYARAMRHLDEGVAAEPENALIGAMRTELDSKLREQMNEDLPERDAVPRLVSSPDAIAGQNLSPKERYILARIDGRRSIHAIMQVSPMRDAEAHEIFRNFRRQGLIAF